MGQDIDIKRVSSLDQVLVIDTDRSLTGQDGVSITPSSDRHGVPAVLAERLFALDVGIDYVYVLQNTVTVRRPEGWDEDTAGAVEDVTRSFLRFYHDEEE